MGVADFNDIEMPDIVNRRATTGAEVNKYLMNEAQNNKSNGRKKMQIPGGCGHYPFISHPKRESSPTDLRVSCKAAIRTSLDLRMGYAQSRANA